MKEFTSLNEKVEILTKEKEKFMLNFQLENEKVNELQKKLEIEEKEKKELEERLDSELKVSRGYFCSNSIR